MNEQSTLNKTKETPAIPAIQRRRSKLIKKIRPEPKKVNFFAWLCCFWASPKNKVLIKEKSESILYIDNQDSKEDVPAITGRKPEFNKSLSSELIKSNSQESHNSSFGKLRSSHNKENNNQEKTDLNRKLSRPPEKIKLPIFNVNERKQNAIDSYYYRRHSWNVAALNLPPIQEVISGQYEENGSNVIDQGDSASIEKKKKKKRKHKGSWDSSSSSSKSGNGTMSNQRLLMKAQEVKANNALLNSNLVNVSQGNLNASHSKFGNSIGRNTLQSKNLDSRKESNESAYNGIEVMNDSVAPPMMIDNSAVIFNNRTKSRKSKMVAGMANNPLQSEVNGSEQNMGSKSGEESKDEKDYKETSEGEYDGEGESYSSSCTCSSCIKEKNADNGMSLKLSQYSYKPTHGGFKRNETEMDSSNVLNTSAFKDVVNTSMFGDKSAFGKNPNESRLDKSLGDISKGEQPANIFNNVSQTDFPDNLNNGRFKMKMN